MHACMAINGAQGNGVEGEEGGGGEMKRLRSSRSSALSDTPTLCVENQQRVLERGSNDHVVVNSPYGIHRAQYGWGNLFSAPLSAHISEYPNIHIGISSLNCVPGKDRRMKTLLAQYGRKFNCLEHCYTYHNIGDEAMWRSWAELSPSLSTSSASCSPRAVKVTSPKGGEGEIVEGNCSKRNDMKRSCGLRAGVRLGDGEHHPRFMYTIKANRYLTHTRMLAVDEATEDHILQFFVKRCAVLQQHLGPVLLQLPPQFHKTDENMERIAAVAARIPNTVRVAVEFRHCSWYVEEVHQLLRRFGWALVVVHHHDIPAGSVHVDTGADFMYVRLHGALGPYIGDYGPTLVMLWAERIVEFLRAGDGGHEDDDNSAAAAAPVAAAAAARREVFFFFNNSDSHIGGTTSSTVDATFLARQVRALLAKDGGGDVTIISD